MNNDIKNAKKEYASKNYEKSLEIFEKTYNNHPEEFNLNDLISYSWAVYQVHVKNSKDEDELSQATEFITNLIPQADLNSSNTCSYTFSVFKVLEYLNNENEYYDMGYWLDKLNPELLDEKSSKYRSRKQDYYSYLSKSYLNCAEWESCIQASNDALNNLKRFTGDNKIWFKWRIAKSLRQLNKNQEALTYLKQIVKVRNDWYIQKEIAQNYIELNNSQKAMKYFARAVLTDDLSHKKVNLHYLIYEFLNETHPEIAFKHIELYKLLKDENNAYIPYEIEELDINVDDLDKKELEEELKRFWYELEYNNKKLEYGTICEIKEDDSGYIVSNNLESVFFNKSDFEGDYLKEGMYVSFLTEKIFDKTLNKELVKAIDIKEE